MNVKVSKLIVLMSLLTLLLVSLSGCAGTMQAIEHRDMSLAAKMSDTIFLDPETLTKNRNIYVRVTNTSDFQEIDFGELLKGKLSAKGCTKEGEIVPLKFIFSLHGDNLRSTLRK